MISLAILLVTSFTYVVSKQIVLNEKQTNASKTLQNVEDYFLDNFMKDMAYVVTYWADHPEILNYADPPAQGRITNTIPPQFRPLYNQWLGFTTSQPDIAWIYYGKESNGSIYITPVDPTMPLDYDARTRDWYQGAIKSKNTPYWSQPYLDAGDSGEVIVTVSKSVFKNNKPLGVIGLDIKLKKFSDIVRTIRYGENNKGYLMLLNEKGIVYASPDSQQLNKDLSHSPWVTTVLTTPNKTQIVTINGVSMIVSHLTVKETGWKLVGIQPLALEESMQSILTRMVIIGLICLFLTFIFGRSLSKLFTRPIHKLTDVMSQVSEGNMDVRSRLKTGDEMETLSNHFNGMMAHINALMVERDQHVSELEFKNFEIIHQREEITIYSEETEAMNEELLHLVDEIKSNYLVTVTVLANAIEASDCYTRGHCDRVTRLALATAEQLQMSQSHLANLEFASILHDIGKIGVPSHLLNKETPLTPEEFNRICTHPQIGYEILKDVKFLKEASLIIRQHHERYDGKGYPLGLKGHEINLSARILSVADAFDAMTSSRPYRKEPLSNEEAINQLNLGKNNQFDSEVVDAFLAVLTKADSAELTQSIEQSF